MKKIRTLAIETSTALGSVAISEHDADGENCPLIFSESFTADRSHSAQLFAVLERALASLTMNSGDQIVVGLGPGSYSGVRVAIAAAIGLRFGLKARLAGRNSLTAIPTAEPHYCCIGDARQSSFYFCEIKNREVIQPPTLFSETELHERLAQFRGQARSQARPGDEEKLAAETALPIFAPSPISAFPEAQIAQPSAEILAQLTVSEARTEGEANDLAVSEILEPIYLRPPHITQPKPVR